jgi:YHS domain-containing protein
VRTACGGLVKYSASTPCVKFRGQRVFFCLPVCKADFENDPMSSCMAVHIQDNV